MHRDNSSSPPLIPWLTACGTVFISSACIMILELVAGRIIARYIGVSLYTWTAVIGVIMLGMALGNHLGGRLADRRIPERSLAVLFLLAALACFMILPLNRLGSLLSFLGGRLWPLRIFLHVSLVFLIPALLLGMIPPVVVKMALGLKRKAGRTVGSIFAWGVAGSLLGTFLTGYYLVMVWNASTILFVSGGGLGLLGLAYSLHSFSRSVKKETAVAKESESAPDRTNTPGLREWAPAAATVFLSNTAFMAYELGVSRLIAREFGSSLYTWTMVIGLVLGGITFGNYLGGRLADRSFSNRCIAAVLSLSALAVMLSPVWNGLTSMKRGEILFLALLSWPMQIALQLAVLCLVPCFFIGMISPLLVRRSLESGRGAGASVGMIYAWGSLGGIFGTFLSGYWLIQWMGALPMILAVAFSLALAGLLYKPRRILSVGVVLLTCVFLAAALFPTVAPLSSVYALIRIPSAYSDRTVYEEESQYSYIAILQDREEPEVREMLLDQLVHSCIDLRDPTRLLYEYEWVYDSVLEKRHPRPAQLHALVIGGGGYAYPHHLELLRPGSRILVSEIDPAVTEAAHAQLGLPRDTTIDIRDMDARNVIDDLLAQQGRDDVHGDFDYIFGDSINDYTVPYHLTTLEFNQRLHRLLKEDGMYLFNMIDLLDSGAFLSAVVHTCRQVFEEVAVFNTGRPSFVRDTFVVVCSKQALSLDDIPGRLAASHDYTGMRIPNVTLNELIRKNGTLLLTDNFAPVENLLAPVVRTRAGDAGELYLNFARMDAARGNRARALKRGHKALEIHPNWPEASEFLAGLMKDSGDEDSWLEALARAIPGHSDPALAWSNLARAYLEAQRVDEAMAAWKESIRIKPDYVFALYNLGVLHGMRQEIPEAIACWKQAIAAEPDHGDSLYNLAAAHLMVGDIEAARGYVEQMQARNQEVDPQLLEAVQGQARTAPAPQADSSPVSPEEQ